MRKPSDVKLKANTTISEAKDTTFWRDYTLGKNVQDLRWHPALHRITFSYKTNRHYTAWSKQWATCCKAKCCRQCVLLLSRGISTGLLKWLMCDRFINALELNLTSPLLKIMGYPWRGGEQWLWKWHQHHWIHHSVKWLCPRRAAVVKHAQERGCTHKTASTVLSRDASRQVTLQPHRATLWPKGLMQFSHTCTWDWTRR